MLFSQIRTYLGKVLFLVGSGQRKLVLLLPLYLIASAADLVGIGLLVALVSALTDAETLLAIIRRVPVLSGFADSSTTDTLTVMLASLLLFVYAVKTAIAIFVTQLTLKISFNYGAGLRSFLMGVYQRQSYAAFIRRNSSEYIYKIQTLSGQLVTYTVQPMLQLFGDGFLALLIIGFLALKDPFVLAILLTLISVAGLLYDRAYRRKMVLIGIQENNLSASMIKSITEGLNSYRESHIFGVIGFFHQAVASAAFKLAKLRIRSHLISASSRHVLEFVVVISVVCVIVASVVLDRDRSVLLSTLALFLVASTRLVPAANSIVTNIGKMRYGRHSVDALYADIVGAGYTSVDFDQQKDEQGNRGDLKGLKPPFRRMELSEVGFRYAPDAPWVLDSVSLSIEQHDIVGIVGSSGSGKSTMIALMLGLLSPERGGVRLDDADLGDPGNVKAWHRKVAYLPQEVFLIDDTLARNVALGVDTAKIDRERLARALAKARLTELVEKMPDGADTSVGEKGLWVSGGQRQRIALARAFYFNAEVLIMDESTSSLDSETAEEIINELRLLKGKVTIVLISHQEALIRMCNKVFRLTDGRIVCLRDEPFRL